MTADQQKIHELTEELAAAYDQLTRLQCYRDGYDMHQRQLELAQAVAGHQSAKIAEREAVLRAIRPMLAGVAGGAALVSSIDELVPDFEDEPVFEDAESFEEE